MLFLLFAKHGLESVVAKTRRSVPDRQTRGLDSNESPRPGKPSRSTARTVGGVVVTRLAVALLILTKPRVLLDNTSALTR